MLRGAPIGKFGLVSLLTLKIFYPDSNKLSNIYIFLIHFNMTGLFCVFLTYCELILCRLDFFVNLCLLKDLKTIFCLNTQHKAVLSSVNLTIIFKFKIKKYHNLD